MSPSTIVKGFTLVLSLILLAACSQVPKADLPSSTVPWSSEINDLATTSEGLPSEPFVKQVLQDNQISDPEIQESALKQVDCMVSSGYSDYHADPINNQHGFGASLPLSDAGLKKAKKDEESCNRSSAYLDLYSLYSAMKQNPDQQDEMEVVASCLVKLKVVDPSYSGKNYTDDLEKYLREHADANNYVDSDPALGIPFIVSQEEGLQAVYLCRTDPQSALKKNRNS